MNRQIPFKFVSGDSVSFTIDDTCHPASGFSLQYVIGTPTPTVISGTAIDAIRFAVAIAQNVTAAIPPAPYMSYLVFTANDNSSRYSTDPSPLYILVNPLVAPALTPEEIMLNTINAALQSAAGGVNLSVSVNGQTYTKRNYTDLLLLRDRLIVEVGRIQAARGQNALVRGGARKVVTQFYR